MIKVSVMYPNTPGARFNHEYYRDKRPNRFDMTAKDNEARPGGPTGGPHRP